MRTGHAPEYTPFFRAREVNQLLALVGVKPWPGLRLMSHHYRANVSRVIGSGLLLAPRLSQHCAPRSRGHQESLQFGVNHRVKHREVTQVNPVAWAHRVTPYEKHGIGPGIRGSQEQIVRFDYGAMHVTDEVPERSGQAGYNSALQRLWIVDGTSLIESVQNTRGQDHYRCEYVHNEHGLALSILKFPESQIPEQYHYFTRSLEWLGVGNKRVCEWRHRGDSEQRATTCISHDGVLLSRSTQTRVTLHNQPFIKVETHYGLNRARPEKVVMHVGFTRPRGHSQPLISSIHVDNENIDGKGLHWISWGRIDRRRGKA